MKHLRITRLSRLRAVRRWPGRIYRNQMFRLVVAWVALWEGVYWATWFFAARHDETDIVISAAGLFATALMLLALNGVETRKANKFMKQGVEHHRAATRRYALGVLAYIQSRHSGIDSIPAPDGKRAVRCGCGQFIGLTERRIPGADMKIVADWEKHVTSQVKTAMDKFEGDLDARTAG